MPKNTTDLDKALATWLEDHHIRARDIKDYSIESAYNEPTTVRLSVIVRGVDQIEPAPAVTGQTSDGSHTFDELYDHRRALTALLAVNGAKFGESWRSKAHNPTDDPIYPGYFIVGIELSTGMITYHYAMEFWDDFTGVPVLNWAHKWDGATPDETVKRLLEAAVTMAARPHE